MLIRPRHHSKPAPDLPIPCHGVFRQEFGLEDPDYNTWLARRLLDDPGCHLRAWPDACPENHDGHTSNPILLACTRPDGGRYYLLSKHDPAAPRIVHHARYRKSWLSWLRCEVVHDIQVWASVPAPPGYHDWLVFTAWPGPRRAVATDTLLAEDSARFWHPRLAEAQRRQLPMTMVDFVHQRTEPYAAGRWEPFRKQSRELGRWRVQASILIGTT